MMMALAAMHDLPSVLVPGGVTLMPSDGDDAGRVQSMGPRFMHGEMTLQEAAEMGCRACASPGGGCQFLGTAATSQVVGEALGLSLPHAALAPSGHAIWLGWRGARHVQRWGLSRVAGPCARFSPTMRSKMRWSCTRRSAGRRISSCTCRDCARRRTKAVAADWSRINRTVPRLVDALPNGPRNHPTVQVFQAGGVPEVMLHLRRAGLLKVNTVTVSGESVKQCARLVGIVGAAARVAKTNARA